MADTITVSKSEYRYLKDIKKKYEVIQQMVSTDLFKEPPTRDVKKVMKDFRASGFYNKDFLNSLEQGLKESSYFSKRSAKTNSL